MFTDAKTHGTWRPSFPPLQETQGWGSLSV